MPKKESVVLKFVFMPRRRLGQLEKKFEVGSMPAIKHVLQNQAYETQHVVRFSIQCRK